jgi:hypothetical protein
MAVNPESIASWGLLGGTGEGGGGTEPGPTQILAEPIEVVLAADSLTVEIDDE